MVEKTITEKEKSAFNSALKYLERIHEILRGLDMITVERETETGSKKLMNLWRQNYGLLISLHKELRPSMDKKEQEEHDEAKDFIQKEFNKTKKEYNKGNSVKFDFLDNFDAWEQELRQFSQMKGLIMPSMKSALEAAGL